MGKPELFSYLSAFVTIVLAVALTDMIQSSHRLLRARSRVKWDGRPLLFAGVVALCVVSEFFSLWSTFDVSQISMARLLWLLTVPTAFALLAYSALPDEMPEQGIDLSVFWEAEHRTWAIMWLIVTTLDFARSMEPIVSHGGDVQAALKFMAPIEAGVLGSAAIIYFSRRKAWSWGGLLLLAATVIYGVQSWGIVTKPVPA